MVAIPFIISRIYAGDALLLANITVVFYFGSLIANFGLLKFMPLSRPGQVYLILQLSRVLVLYLIWYEPSMTWLWIAAAFWGFNMGVTNTMSRVMIQEIAEPAFRARLMSVFTLGLMSASPYGIFGAWHRHRSVWRTQCLDPRHAGLDYDFLLRL